jgi:hypothetical protein
VLQSLTPELLKDFEIMDDYSLKGKIEMSARVRSFLTGLRARYWKETSFQIFTRMLEANIAVANGVRWRDWAGDPGPQSELWRNVPTVAERLAEHFKLPFAKIASVLYNKSSQVTALMCQP